MRTNKRTAQAVAEPTPVVKVATVWDPNRKETFYRISYFDSSWDYSHAGDALAFLCGLCANNPVKVESDFSPKMPA